MEIDPVASTILYSLHLSQSVLLKQAYRLILLSALQQSISSLIFFLY